MAKFESDTKVRATRAHLAVPVQDETILLHASEGAYYGLNVTGSRVWQLLATETTVGAVVDALATEYGAARDVVAADVEQLVGALLERGFAEIVSA